MAAATRRRVLLALAVLLVLVGTVPLLRANAAARERAWQERCTSQGGTVWAEAADTANPLVVHTGHPVQRCIGSTGVVVSVRD